MDVYKVLNRYLNPNIRQALNNSLLFRACLMFGFK